MQKAQIGKVTHYFGKINVAVVKLSESLVANDTVSFEGVTTNFYQPVDSMEIDMQKIEKAEPGQSVGMKVKSPVRTGDLVFKIIS